MTCFRKFFVFSCLTVTAVLLSVFVSAECTEHAFGDWINMGELRYRECLRCEASEYADLPVHTCVFSGNLQKDAASHYHVCAICEMRDAEPHTFGEWSTTTAATVTDTGVRSRSCTVCDYFQHAVIDRLPAVEPTTDAATEPENSSADAASGNSGDGWVYHNEWNNPFIDINENHPYYDAVRFVSEERLFVGIETDDGLTFAPGMTMNRAMFVTVLGRLAGLQDDVGTGTAVLFSDVEAGAWYAPYVTWAHECGLILGYDDGTFGADDLITVEQAAVIMARFARFCGIDAADAPDTMTAFSDSGAVSSWALQDVRFCLSVGIYAPDNQIMPQSPATRALVADMLFRFTECFGKTNL